jgi:hypothetical protein
VGYVVHHAGGSTGETKMNSQTDEVNAFLNK